MADKGDLMLELKQRMLNVTPLPEEETFHTDTQTLMRFLKARDWEVDSAEKLLKETVEWRRRVQPLTLDCRWCHERPGYHALRQVGNDELGRPVMYSCFSQAAVHKNTVDDSVTHSTYLIENARRAMPPGVYTWVFVMDCTGMTLPACNPKLGYGCTKVMSNHYPERLGLVICINHSAVFQGVWNAIKVVLHPNTVAKMQLVRSKKKVKDIFDLHFPADLSDWLVNEIKLNKQKPLPPSQRAFWRKPEDAGSHDPRGCPSYIREHVDGFCAAEKASPKTVYRPHPNIIDELRGVAQTSTQAEVVDARGAEADADSSDAEENETGADIEIDEEYEIPKGVESLAM